MVRITVSTTRAIKKDWWTWGQKRTREPADAHWGRCEVRGRGTTSERISRAGTTTANVETVDAGKMARNGGGQSEIRFKRSKEDQ